MKPWTPPEDRLYPVLDDVLDEWTKANHRFNGVRVVGDGWLMTLCSRPVVALGRAMTRLTRHQPVASPGWAGGDQIDGNAIRGAE